VCLQFTDSDDSDEDSSEISDDWTSVSIAGASSAAHTTAQDAASSSIQKPLPVARCLDFDTVAQDDDNFGTDMQNATIHCDAASSSFPTPLPVGPCPSLSYPLTFSGDSYSEWLDFEALVQDFNWSRMILAGKLARMSMVLS
jgi:hypothetical protein